jgi:hypothetical protein
MTVHAKSALQKACHTDSHSFKGCPGAASILIIKERRNKQKGLSMSANLPICPILSIRNPAVDELCLSNDCALYLPSAKKCSLVYIGFKAMMEVQRMQQPTPQAAPSPSKPSI